ncbi:DUF4270 domain-containing protein [Spirosoma agri]|uniref:DUF4270 domain-containing protein n=2 Tax=Spirosoma agri TaxID=1987381 RepID=A0A6M0IG25_9BACT|nr:DUF4270 domain-containing protein [Spirosoma agri]
MRTFWYAGLLMLTGIVLFACQSGDLNVGQSVINPQELLVQSIDSVTIQTSTVLRTDSFPTSTDQNILVGQWTDARTGRLQAKAFSSIDYVSNSFPTQTTLRVDSLVLELGYGYAYGDTTSAFNLSVYRLNRVLPSGIVFYNTSNAAYETTPFLQQTITPRPISGTRPVRLRLPAAMAQEFYAKLVSGEINNSTTLDEYMPGFAFVSQSTSTNVFLGFAIGSTSGLRLYYHDTDINQTASSLLFPLSSLHFTQLKNDRSGTVLSTLKTRTDAVNSTQTDNTTAISWGAGLQTRIEFPFLGNFYRPDQFADFNSALLVVGPVRQSLFDNTAPPSSLALYEVNNNNDIIASVPGTSTGGSAAIAGYTLNRNSLITDDTYTFDLTYYIGQIIKRKIPNRPLILTLYPSGSPTTLRELVQRVTLGNQQRQNDRIKLQLYMTSSL